MTFENRMKAAETLMKKGVKATKDARVKEYEDHARKLAEEKKASNASKRGKK
ncbi:hypothetical protein GQ473_00190 [archaeon]|nr:hypothetical protein [archaeon]